MRCRLSARLLVLDPRNRLLLFHFVHAGPVAGPPEFWATPGGALEPGEDFASAALRELAEETGIRRGSVGVEVHRRQFELAMPSGEIVWADERFFLVRSEDGNIRRDGWTPEERAVMREHRWWSVAELEETAATLFPPDLPAILRRLLQG